MELVGAYGDLCSQTKLSAVVESSGCVDEHGGGVHLVQKPHGVGIVLCHDGVGVAGAVGLYVVQSLVQRVHNSDPRPQRQVFGGPVLFGDGYSFQAIHSPQHGESAAVASHLDADLGEAFRDLRQV